MNTFLSAPPSRPPVEGEGVSGQRARVANIFLSVDPAAIDTVLDMVGQSGPDKTKLFDNSIVERLVQQGLIEKLYKGGKS